MNQPIKALVFDAYGTLFDVHSVVRLCDELFPGRGAQLSQISTGRISPSNKFMPASPAIRRQPGDLNRDMEYLTFD